MPLTRRFCFIALVCGHLCAQSAGKQFYSLEKELALGRQLAEDTRKRTKLVENGEVQEFAGRVGKRLSAQLSSPFPLTFEVVTGLPGNPTHEPPELPGGFLFIPAELVLAAHDEDEFAGMLAHSIAHVVNRDTTRSAVSGQLMSYGTIPLIFMGGWQDGLAIPQAFLRTAKMLEAHADADAVGAMSKAGYDPHALVRYIARVQPETTSGRSPFPQREARIAALESAIQGLGASEGLLKVQEHLRQQLGGPSLRKPPSLFQ